MGKILVAIIVLLMFAAIVYITHQNFVREFNSLYVGQRICWRENRDYMIYEITDLEHDVNGDISVIKVKVSDDDIREFTFADYVLGTIYRAE